MTVENICFDIAILNKLKYPFYYVNIGKIEDYTSILDLLYPDGHNWIEKKKKKIYGSYFSTSFL